MDAQPTTTSTAPATASQEIALVPNLPTFNNGQNILAAIQTMNTNIVNLRTDFTTIRTDVNTLRTDVATLRTDVNTLRTDVNTLRTDVNTLRTDVNTLDTKFDDLDLRMRAESAYILPIFKLHYNNIL